MPRRLMHPSTLCSDSKLQSMTTEMFHPEEEEVAEVAEEVAEVEPKAVAEDKMPSKLLELPTTTSQLCESEDLFDLQSKVLPDSSLFDQWSLKTTERFALDKC